MASALIHLAIAKKVGEKVKVKNTKDYYLGAIAPDISKQIGQSKTESHFIINTKQNVPNIKIFAKRYPLFKHNSFDLGYYTHLYADKIWFEEFIPSLVESNTIKLLDGTSINTTTEEITNLIYSDYTNLNIQIIEDYNIDLSLFYEEFSIPKTNIKEIPIEKLDILINKMSIIIENSTQKQSYIIDKYAVNHFIETTAEKIIKELKKY